MKIILSSLFRISLLTVAMFAALTLAGLIPGEINSLSPQETAQVPAARLAVAFLVALATGYPIMRSRWHGLKLILTMALALFCITQLLTLGETLLYRSDASIPLATQVTLALRGLLQCLIYSILAVLILGKMKPGMQAGGDVRFNYDLKGWLLRFGLLALLFVGIYYACGYFIAWRNADLRAYYSGALNHSAWLTIPVQILRGLLWALTALPVIKMLHGWRLENALALAVLFGITHASGLLIPNPYLPAAVARVHMLELLVSISLMGLISGLVLNVQRDDPAVEG